MDRHAKRWGYVGRGKGVVSFAEPQDLERSAAYNILDELYRFGDF